jgi:hypothetical protein
MATSRRYWMDLETMLLTEGLGDRQPARELSFKLRDSAEIGIQFHRGGVPALLPAGSALNFGIKARGDYAGPFLALADSWEAATTTGLGTDETDFYRSTLDFNTVEAAALFDVESGFDEPDSAEAMAEIEVDFGGTGSLGSSQTVPALVINDVIRGTEGFPTESDPVYPSSASLIELLAGAARNHNWDAEAAPTATNDETENYQKGSFWRYDGTVWLCVDNTEDAAVWSEIPSDALAAIAYSGSWDDLSDIPSFADVATSGDYADLSGTPVLSDVATSGDYDDLSNTPALADVATSGAYADLSGAPTLPPRALPNGVVEPVTSITLTKATHAKKLVWVSGASARTLTIGPQSSNAWEADDFIYIRASSSPENITIQGGSGVTFYNDSNAVGTSVFAGSGNGRLIWRSAENVWRSIAQL